MLGDAPETWHEAVEIQLVRHGETETYTRDAGLTQLGREQSRTYAHDLAAALADGEVLRLVCAPAARAARTADEVCRTLQEETRVQVQGPEVMREFQNFQVCTPSGLRDVTQISRGEREQAARLGQGGDGPLWLFEVHQFRSKRTKDGGAIEHWLKSPLLSFEPPALVVRRFWLGARRVVSEPEAWPRIVCCTHSGPMRAFAAWALGRDLGEPDHLERVTIHADRDLRRARVTYRGASQAVPVPPIGEGPVWWDTGRHTID
ncbi:MAG: histidine phosphatase family protein [Candidatus Dormibacteraeota bacterium]|nr:histidine phosphatase family protein [Candidatus Dormibacteraeota bacterium]MBO0762695.1 histidine phosphatase family protein [Candidatus Dormibacteraeota bacterium]